MKKKILALVLCVALAAVAIVGGTLAYFTDSEEQTNTFTAGEVKITLDEARIKKDTNGYLIKDGDSRTGQSQTYKLFPGMTVTKDPTITVGSGSEKAYIGAKITVKGDLFPLIGVEGGNIDITKDDLVSGGIMPSGGSTVESNWHGLSFVYKNDTCTVYQKPGDDNEENENDIWTIYVFINEVQTKGAKIVLFDTLKIPPHYDNVEMARLNHASVTVEAFAVQEYGFSDCYTAMTTAFDEDFADCITTTP